MNSRVVVTGATGTIGTALSHALINRGDSVIALSRDPQHAILPAGVETHAWPSPTTEPPPAEALTGASAVINLLGEPISQRWTKAAKQRIRDSRVQATGQLVQALLALPPESRPKTLISQSATGYYGDHPGPALDETSAPGTDWLAGVVIAWEQAALEAGEQLRVAVTRTGVVLSPEGGALEKMLPFFRAGIGGPIGSGKQWLPWIHLDDVVGGLLACLDDPSAAGPFNLVAPHSATNKEFAKALGHALHRPALLPVPGLAIKTLYGEMGSIVTGGQAVNPARLLASGYEFRYPELEAALIAAVGS
jgi:uncharacterized protein (TIGR01777 family)